MRFGTAVVQGIIYVYVSPNGNTPQRVTHEGARRKVFTCWRMLSNTIVHVYTTNLCMNLLYILEIEIIY